jgi:catechol 2,3-dioxygenase-like lactoylglutathione lyase family enzyme
MNFGIHHVGATVNDLDRALAFYTGVLGFEPLFRHDFVDVPGAALGVPGPARLRWGYLRAGEVLIELHEYATPRGGHRTCCDAGTSHIALGVDDIDRACAVLAEVPGFRLFAEPARIEEGAQAGTRWVYGSDPFGVVLELYEPARRGS